MVEEKNSESVKSVVTLFSSELVKDDSETNNTKGAKTDKIDENETLITIKNDTATATENLPLINEDEEEELSSKNIMTSTENLPLINEDEEANLSSETINTVTTDVSPINEDLETELSSENITTTTTASLGAGDSTVSLNFIQA